MWGIFKYAIDPEDPTKTEQLCTCETFDEARNWLSVRGVSTRPGSKWGYSIVQIKKDCGGCDE